MVISGYRTDIYIYERMERKRSGKKDKKEIFEDFLKLDWKNPRYKTT